LETPNNLLEKTYHALQNKRLFYSTNYGVSDKKFDRIPDFRNTLYWNPSVSFDGVNNIEVEFYTGDDTGNYQIQINGITNTGIPFQAYKTFSVVND
jgi:hypothetical protein